MIYPGYVVQCEAWFGPEDNDNVYDAYCDLTSEDRDHKASAYTEIDYLGSGYDYIHFYRKSEARKYYKRLLKIGVPEDNIHLWTINQVKQF